MKHVDECNTDTSWPVRGIILMGIQAAGKTRLGDLLAEGLGAPFLDADDIPKAAEGISLVEAQDRQLVDVLGRRAVLLRDVLTRPPAVFTIVATTMRPLRNQTGSLDADVREHLGHWFLVWLDNDPQAIATYLLKHHAACLRRPWYRDCHTHRALAERAVAMQNELEPVYRSCNARRICLSRLTEQKQLQRIFTEFAIFLLDRDNRKRQSGSEGTVQTLRSPHDRSVRNGNGRPHSSQP